MQRVRYVLLVLSLRGGGGVMRWIIIVLAACCLACTSVQAPEPEPTPGYETLAERNRRLAAEATPTLAPIPDSEQTLDYPPFADLPLWEYGFERASVASAWLEELDDVFVLDCMSGQLEMSIEVADELPLPDDGRDSVSVAWLVVDEDGTGEPTREVWAKSRDGRTLYASGLFVLSYFDGDRAGRIIETDVGGYDARVFVLWPRVPLDTSRLSCFP